MPFSIEHYKRKLQVHAAQTGRRSTAATASSAAAAAANAAFVFEGLQKKYLDFCVAKTLNPDDTLLASLKTRSFVLKFDAFSEAELSLHVEFLQKTRGLRQLVLSLSSATADRDVRKKFERLGLSKAPAFKKESAALIIRSACAACVKSPNLTRLQVQGIAIADSQAALLSKALAKCDMLEIAILSGTLIGDKGLEALSLTLGKCPRLFCVNLSECKLTPNASHHLAKIITLHGIQRDEAAWSASLRGATVPSEKKRPTFLMDLSHNALGDASINAICAALYHDKWVLGLNLVDNGLTFQGLTLCRDTLRRSNSTLAVLKLSEQNATAESESIVRSVDAVVPKRIRYLRALSAESSERRLFLCNLLLEWNVEQDIVLQLCDGACNSKITVARQTEQLNNQESHNDGDDNGNGDVIPPSKPPATTDSNHIHTIKFLVDRLSAMEAEQHKTAQHVERLEEENHELRATVAAMAEKRQDSASPKLEESVITQLEASIAMLATQIEDLERERNTRTWQRSTPT